jgi:uncharacterized membrane protein (DUF485 family)
MDEKDLEAELVRLAARRWRIAVALTAIMMGTYFGFLFLVAWAKSTAAALVTGGLSWGILLGALVIVVAWVVTGIYVGWANTRYDKELATLRSRLEAKDDHGDERGAR